MIKVGITGGMGSGKSVVATLFRLHGVPVFDADKEAKLLNDTSLRIREELTHHFGNSLYEGGKLDRKRFAQIIFHDEKRLALANSIIHPVLTDHFIEWAEKRDALPLVAIDAALLFEAGFDQLVDRVAVVFAPLDIRLDRVMHRDGTQRSEAEGRMQHQIPEEEKIKRADYVIYNDNHHSLIQQVAGILYET